MCISFQYKMTDICYDCFFSHASCPLCLEIYVSTDEGKGIAALPCGHCFHQDCLQRHTYLYMSEGCPMCRKQVRRFLIIFVSYFQHLLFPLALLPFSTISLSCIPLLPLSLLDAHTEGLMQSVVIDDKKPSTMTVYM